MRSISVGASSQSATIRTAPCAVQLARAISARGSRARCRSIAASTAAAKVASSVTRIACAALSCSACDKKIGGDPIGVVVAIGDDQDLGRAGDHVDADPAEDAPLGRGDIGVAGPDDLVDRRRSSRCHRRAPRPPGRRRSDRFRRCRPAGRRRAPAGSTGRPASAPSSPAARRRRPWPGSRSSAPRRDRPRCRPARKARPRRSVASARRAARRPHRHSRSQPAVDGGESSRSARRRGAAPPPSRPAPRRASRRSRAPRHAQAAQREIEPVEAPRVVEQRRVAAAGDILDDRRDRRIDIGSALALRFEEPAKFRRESGRRGGQKRGIRTVGDAVEPGTPARGSASTAARKRSIQRADLLAAGSSAPGG